MVSQQPGSDLGEFLLLAAKRPMGQPGQNPGILLSPDLAMEYVITVRGILRAGTQPTG